MKLVLRSNSNICLSFSYLCSIRASAVPVLAGSGATGLPVGRTELAYTFVV